MDGSLDEAAGQSQVHGCSSYPLSFPSQPPDIKNWFSSYEYESPEVPELVADPGGHDGSETQDPLEHSLFMHVPWDGGVALRENENRLGDQLYNDVFDRKDLVPIDESMVKRPPKRKQSLRALFGVSFLNKHEEATESECQMASNVQRNAPEPLPTCNAAGLLDTKQSQEDATEHGKLPADCNGISSVDTQVSSPAEQEIGYCKLPVTCVGSSLADILKCFPEDGIKSAEHSKEPVACSGISSADTQISSPADQEVGYSKLPVTVGSGLADIQKCFPEDGIDNIKMPINFVGTNLASTEKCFRDDVEYSILPVRNDNINLADTEENFPAGKIGHCKPALDGTESEETVASNGFVAIKRKKATEEHKMKKIPKSPMGRENATSHGNRSTFEQKILVQGHTRSPLADRTNFSEAVAAPTLEFCGKWKCPRKGKPSVGPPMKQLRLEQWLRQEN